MTASASGVFDAARPGSVPRATTCTRRHDDRDDDDRHDQGKRHGASWIAGFARRHRNRPRIRRTQKSTAVRSTTARAIVGARSGTSSAGSTKKIPTATKTTSGSSLPTVSTLSTRLLCRIPRMLIAAIATMIEAMKAARGQPDAERRRVERERRREHVDDRRPARGTGEPQHPARPRTRRTGQTRRACRGRDRRSRRIGCSPRQRTAR